VVLVASAAFFSSSSSSSSSSFSLLFYPWQRQDRRRCCLPLSSSVNPFLLFSAVALLLHSLAAAAQLAPLSGGLGGRELLGVDEVLL
jgi:hypothetical protein